MNRLTRFLFTCFLLCFFSLAWGIATVFLQDPNGNLLSGSTPQQTLTIAGLALLTGLFGLATLIFWRKPSWSEASFLAMDRLLQKPHLHTLVMAGLIGVILLGSILLMYILTSGGERAGNLFMRSFPVVFLMFALPILSMGLFLDPSERERWMRFALVLLLCSSAGIIFQTILLNHLERPVLIGLRERVVAHSISILVLMVFVLDIEKLPKRERIFWILMAALVGGIYLIQWMTFPSKLWRIKPALGLYAFTFFFGLPLITKILMEIWSWLVAKTQGKVIRVARLISVGVLLLLAFLYYQAATKHMNTINKKINSSDQAFYIEFIKDVYRSNFTSTGDHNRMPLYPYLQALFYRSDMTDKELFLQGKHINIVLSLALLVLLFLIFLRRLQFSQAILLILILAFSLYIFKAAYIQAEILFFTLSAISFILMLEMLKRPGWLLAMLTGGITGLAYLTKGTVLPSILLFVVLFSVKQAHGFIQGRKIKDPARARKLIVQSGYVIVLLAVFTAAIYPYIREMKQRFGQYFYNVNTTFYIWLDSYDQALLEEEEHHYADSWPTHLSEDQIPSLRRYLNEHTTQQILERFLIGFTKELENLYRQYNVSNFPLSYIVIFLLAICLDARNSWRTAKNYPYLVLFTILFFLGYLVAFSWYYPIAGGRRFMYGLFIPFLYTVFASINELAKQQASAWNDKIGHTLWATSKDSIFASTKGNQINLTKFFAASNTILALTLVYNIWLVTTEVLFFGRYGS